MLRNYFLINLLLVLILAFLGIKLYGTVTHTIEMPAGLTDKQKERKVQQVRRAPRIDNIASFEVISNLDLFRPSRSASVKKVVKTEKAPPKDPPKVFGTVIFNNFKSAILEDPDTKSTKTYSVNDSVAGYVISDILEDKVVLSRDGESFEVKLRESKGVTAPKRSAVKRQSRAKRTVSKPRKRRPQRTRRAVPPRRSRAQQPPPQQRNTSIHNDREMQEIENMVDDMDNPR